MIGFIHHGGSGRSTYDAVAMIMSGTWTMSKFKYIRIATDFVLIALSVTLYLLSGYQSSSISAFVCLGTILTAFFLGPLIDIFNCTIALPLLQGKKTFSRLPFWPERFFL